MPLLYLDASAAVAAIVREAATERVQRFLREPDAGAHAISGWVVTEVASALSLKLRRGEIGVDLAAAAHARFEALAASAVMLGVADKAFVEAAAWCRRHELGLRAGDALHLAIAAGAGCTVVTLDERMAQAAGAVGVAIHIP